VYNTWEHYLQGLKPAWNGNRRLAIDVPGQSLKFHYSDEGTSWANEAEAQLICDSVKGALEVEVPENGMPLTCDNFLVMVLYGAQGGLATKEMYRMRSDKPDGCVILENTRVA
jgi:hypothetical protein